MNILDNIISKKLVEVEQRKMNVPVAVLETYSHFSAPTISMIASLKRVDSTGIIAEFKRYSPSNKLPNTEADLLRVLQGYNNYGAAGISILTDEHFFGGKNDDVIKARSLFEIPVLRKDFIIDEYQITESRAIGASVILLIAGCLTPQRVKDLSTSAKRLQLEVLLEIHNESELEHICESVDMVGVNNRDLRTFKTNVQNSFDLADKIPADKIKISESGISDVDTIHQLRKSGYEGFLIGEQFMKSDDPAFAFSEFIQKLKS